MLDGHFANRLDWPDVRRKLVVGDHIMVITTPLQNAGFSHVQLQFRYHLFPGTPFLNMLHVGELIYDMI